MESPTLQPSSPSAFAMESGHRHLSVFPSLSPLPSPTEQLLSSAESGMSSLSWPQSIAPLQPRRGNSLPEWINDMAASPEYSTDSRQPPTYPSSPSISTGLTYFQPQHTHSLPPRLSHHPAAVSTWTSITAASFSTSISPSTSSSMPPPLQRVHNNFIVTTSPTAAFQMLRTTSSSSSSSSPDSSSPSSSSSPSASSSFPTTAPTPRRRYQRLTGLSQEQRMERRRQSHRELDAVRRQREALAINRLAELTATANPRTTRPLATQHPHSRSHSSLADTPVTKQEDEQMAIEMDVMETDEKGKRHRTAVLENTVEKLEELQSLVHHLTATCTQQSDDIAALRLQIQSSGLQPLATAAIRSPHAVPLLSAANIRRVVAEFGATSLYSALFVSPSVGLLLVDCASGLALDANDRLLVGGQCTREDVIGRLVAPTYHAITTSSDWDTPPASPQSADTTARMHVRGQPALLYSQYGVTKESVLSLYRGQVDQVHVVWRAQLGDGLAYELPLTSFIASRDDGGRPRTVIVALSLSEAKRI